MDLLHLYLIYDHKAWCADDQSGIRLVVASSEENACRIAGINLDEIDNLYGEKLNLCRRIGRAFENTKPGIMWPGGSIKNIVIA